MATRVARRIKNPVKDKIPSKVKILNNAKIRMTVVGEHMAMDMYYDKWEGDAFKLAQVMIDGSYGGPPRPFMKVIKEELEASKELKEFTKKHITWNDKKTECTVDWDSIAHKMETLAHEYMMFGIVAGKVAPLKPNTVYKKHSEGYNGSETLYASGQLAHMIVAQVVTK